MIVSSGVGSFVLDAHTMCAVRLEIVFWKISRSGQCKPLYPA